MVRRLFLRSSLDISMSVEFSFTTVSNMYLSSFLTLLEDFFNKFSTEFLIFF